MSPAAAPAWPEQNNHCLFLSNGVFDPHESANLPGIFAAYTKAYDEAVAKGKPAPPLVMHFHGGLVPKSAGLEAAQLLATESYGKAGAFPVFFIWESGFVESLQQALPQIFREAIFELLMERVAGYALGAISHFGGDGTGITRGEEAVQPASPSYVKRELNGIVDGAVASGPFVPFADIDPHSLPEDATLRARDENKFLQDLSADRELQKEAAKIAQGLRPEEDVRREIENGGTRGEFTAPVRASEYTLMSPGVLDEMRPDVTEGDEVTRGLFSAAAAMARITTGAARILKNVVWRFASRRDHGVQATIVEEILREFYLANIGKAVWDAMKTNAQNAWQMDGNLFGGTEFLKGLKKLGETGHKPPRIVLVGHSTGAIYICALIEAAAKMALAATKFDIVYLAPAVDFKRLANTLTGHPDLISNFRVFGMKDSVERDDHLLDVPQLNAVPFLKGLYPGSLLYFVSGALEGDADKPIVGMARYYEDDGPYSADAFPEIATVKAFVAGSPNRCVWSKTEEAALSGLQTLSFHHGDFDNEDRTLQSLAYICQTGYNSAGPG